MHCHKSAGMFVTHWLRHSQLCLSFGAGTFTIHTLRLVEWLDLQGTIRNNPQTKPYWPVASSPTCYT